jgi:allantoinase
VQRFNLPVRITATGSWPASLALVDLNQEFEVHTEDLFYRHRQTPYAGRKLRGKVIRTLVRGQTVFHDGKIIAKPVGRLVKPNL